MDNITLVIPAKFESHSLPMVLDELKGYNHKILIVLQEDDFETINSIKDYNCEILYQKNKGYGDALIEGINHTKTKYFCIFNADGSFNPNEIDLMSKKLEENKLDFVFASRYQANSGSDDDTILTYVGNFFFTLIGKVFFNLNITDILYTYVIGKTSSGQSLNLERKDFTFCIELPVKAKQQKFKIDNINSYERKRLAGFKKVNEIKDGFLILKYLIILFFKKFI
jgi:glycosyltransferase involved in cell wall biosynthesis|tara:strand:+ start:1559 stop:2233 length:675 start_codon:yes stop_codon:yes gene_type:complete